MTESVHAELEQMFWQKAKIAVITHGVGRTAYPGSSGGDETVCLDAQKRECQEPKAYEFLQKKFPV